MPITTTIMQPVIQEGVYDALKARQDKIKHFYDRSAKKTDTRFKVGDRIVTKIGNEKIWEPVGEGWSDAIQVIYDAHISRELARQTLYQSKRKLKVQQNLQY
ncbi:hypothetical protein PR048_001764 [Dryococelus australis]|uniref:Uncharacterized protein n=1 Tax=Dryococelus australis TaxID=614101 RepID=A0ABQ9II91_9NEOP|nr:hypothetical protein PR048_001764 [Dryococelus australis]